jgi:hypothetical protein
MIPVRSMPDSIIDPKLKAMKVVEPLKPVEHKQLDILQEVIIPSSDIEQIVRNAAIRYGVNPDYLVKIARCESGLNPTSVNHGYNENGYPSGLFQHLSGYWPARAAKYGYAGASVFDPEAQANVTAGMFRDGSSGLWECK